MMIGNHRRIITDGDLRRMLENRQHTEPWRKDIMSSQSQNDRSRDIGSAGAGRNAEERYQPVAGGAGGKYAGIIHLHDR